MLESIQLQNFKSARELQVKLAPLTVLTGLNGSGKSTVLQAIALLKQSLRSGAAAQRLLLQGPLVRLGRSEDVRFENAEADEIGFVVALLMWNLTTVVDLRVWLISARAIVRKKLRLTNRTPMLFWLSSPKHNSVGGCSC